MCVVSAVSSDWIDRTQPRFPSVWPIYPPIKEPNLIPAADFEISPKGLAAKQREEIAELKEEVLKLKAELEKARAQDIADGNPDCEMEDKVTIIKGLARLLDVDMGDVFGGHK
jgi:hypothetical protein